MAALKLTRIGNSVGVILPKDMLARLKVEKGDTLHVTDTPDGLRLTPHDPRFAAQMKHVRRIAKKRRPVLRAMAKRGSGYGSSAPLFSPRTPTSSPSTAAA